MAGAARRAPDLIDMMGGDSEVPGAGHRRPQRKRVRTTRALESMRQRDDMDWEEENSSKKRLGNDKNVTIRAAAADDASEEVQGTEQRADHDFNTKLAIKEAEFQFEFRKLRDKMAEDVAKMTAQLTQELSQAREDLKQARSELEHTRLQLHAMTWLKEPNRAGQRMRTSHDIPRRSAFLPQPPPPVGVPEEHANEATPMALRKLVEKEMQSPGDQPSWRCAAVTTDGGTANRLRVVGRNKDELKKIKDILEAKKAPGARVLRDQLYPVKVDNVNSTAVIDHGGKVLLGAAEALGQENDVQIAKLA
ncbi:hypothetical protein N657DRAFT_675812 [Parathielavia appendiculata]|uniref:Uncharacterized protein n=1 Tax=Parathielavia appendiculata TaxID=2587402 RepID=A0AAN6TP47_9PEZI|nr:hypothetical protein N657DRAFT_675812 [Parathielavia appendiculata]